MKPGNIIEYIDSQKIVCAVVTGVQGRRLRLLTETNREVNISMNRIAHQTGALLDLSMGNFLEVYNSKHCLMLYLIGYIGRGLHSRSKVWIFQEMLRKHISCHYGLATVLFPVSPCLSSIPWNLYVSDPGRNNRDTGWVRNSKCEVSRWRFSCS